MSHVADRRQPSRGAVTIVNLGHSPQPIVHKKAFRFGHFVSAERISSIQVQGNVFEVVALCAVPRSSSRSAATNQTSAPALHGRLFWRSLVGFQEPVMGVGCGRWTVGFVRPGPTGSSPASFRGLRLLKGGAPRSTPHSDWVFSFQLGDKKKMKHETSTPFIFFLVDSRRASPKAHAKRIGGFIRSCCLSPKPASQALPGRCAVGSSWAS